MFLLVDDLYRQKYFLVNKRQDKLSENVAALPSQTYLYGYGVAYEYVRVVCSRVCVNFWILGAGRIYTS